MARLLNWNRKVFVSFGNECIVGYDISENDFELLVSMTNASNSLKSLTVVHFVEIDEYEELEKQVIENTNNLYSDVENCVKGCEEEIRNYQIPLSKKEAEAMLEKQDIVINDLQNEIASYKKRAEDIKKRISILQETRRNEGKQAEIVSVNQRESTKEKLLWLYSLKRIIGHSVGITEIQTEFPFIHVYLTKG